MFISLCSINFNQDGDLYLEVSDDNTSGSITRRVSKTKTLDGGIATSDLGFNGADNDFHFTLTSPTEDIAKKLEFLFKYETALTLSSKDGFYIVAPSSLNFQNGVSLILLAVERVA